MVLHGLLPKPLSSDEVTIGQFLTHPLRPEEDGFFSDKAAADIDELNDYHIQLRYKDLFSVDSEGRFVTNYGAKFDLGKIYRQPNLLTVQAEQMIQRTSQSPQRAFEAVCEDDEVQSWVANLAKQGKSFYFVVGITELKNAVFRRARLPDAGASARLSEMPLEKGARVPRSIQQDPKPGTDSKVSGVFGMDIRRVSARITRPAEPHRIADLGSKWIYHDIPGTKDQLMIGLGEPLKADELRLMLDLSEEDVKENLHAISKLSMDALSAAASPLLRPSSPALRGRSPSPHPSASRLQI